jgi:hypothetical protein
MQMWARACAASNLWAITNDVSAEHSPKLSAPHTIYGSASVLAFAAEMPAAVRIARVLDRSQISAQCYALRSLWQLQS